jgi:hypothetical protein
MEVHAIVANVADFLEFISECLTVNLYCERRPVPDFEADECTRRALSPTHPRFRGLNHQGP